MLKRELQTGGPDTILVGHGETPEQQDGKLDAPDPYIVVHPIESGSFEAESGGSLGPPMTAPEADAALEYDVTSVGKDRRQAGWVADRARRVMTGRTATGALVVPLVVEGHHEMDRSSAGPIGAVTLLSGVYQAVDSYRVTVSRDDDPDPEE